MKLTTLAQKTLLLGLAATSHASSSVPIADIVNDLNGTGDISESSSTSPAGGSFNRISTFFVCSQLDPDCNIDDETSAETIWVTKDYNTLVYTDSPGQRVGFVDITDAAAPVAGGFVDLPGEPTTVRIHGNYGKS
jgi:hypothetical protein